MRELIDCHVHTALCGHAKGSVAQAISAGVFRGLQGIVLTEHLPLPAHYDPDGHLAMGEADLAGYIRDIRAHQERVRGLEVVCGAEADWLDREPASTHAAVNTAREAGIEVVLGSVHFLGTWGFDNPHDLSEWDRRDVDEVWRDYFDSWCEATGSGLFDVMAHPDLPKKFGHRPTFDTSELFDKAAECAADAGVAIEVSSAGLRKPVGEVYPGPDLLAAFWRHGVVAVVGSDAHAPAEVGEGIEKAYDALFSAGYREVALPRGAGNWRFIEL